MRLTDKDRFRTDHRGEGYAFFGTLKTSQEFAGYARAQGYHAECIGHIGARVYVYWNGLALQPHDIRVLASRFEQSREE